MRYLPAARRYALPLLSYTTQDAPQAQEEGVECLNAMNYAAINALSVELDLFTQNAVTSPILSKPATAVLGEHLYRNQHSLSYEVLWQ
jgi:hypothetical protein